MYQEFAELIVENIHLLPKKDRVAYDKMGSYLYISSIESSEDMGSFWEGKVSAITRVVSA